MENLEQQPPHHHHHFLIIAGAAQSQLNQSWRLARRLAEATASRATVATSLHCHRRLFPGRHQELLVDDDRDPLVSHVAFSDGYDDGYPESVAVTEYFAHVGAAGTRSLIRLARTLADRGRPVSCIVFNIFVPWGPNLARELGVPGVLFWIQPAAVFSIFYRYFHGQDELISAHRDDPGFSVDLPGLPWLRIRDVPTFLTDTNSPYMGCFTDIMKWVDSDGDNARVLVNTFHALEADAIDAASAAAADKFHLIPVGPLITDTRSTARDLFEEDGSGYMDWLEGKEDESVVYISFGSLHKMSREQMVEIRRGLAESGRPYLWVVRKDNDVVKEKIELESGEGMVVEWCDQLRVLSNRAVGCYLVHGGWQSTLESVGCGVPMVVVPGWNDQRTNARMVEGVWGIGVRAEVNGEGVMEGGELKRCLDVVMGEGDMRAEIRRKAEMWKRKASEALPESTRNIAAFVDGL